MSGSPAMARKVGSQSWCWTISLEIWPGWILPGQRTTIGTRNAPSQLVFFSLRNGVIAPSGQEFMCGPLSVEYMTSVLSSELVESVEHLTDVLVVIDHRVVVRRLPASRLSLALRLGVGEEMHVRGVEPDEERLARVVLALDEISRRGDEFVVAGLHALLCERAGVGDSLLSDPSPARLFGRIVG